MVSEVPFINWVQKITVYETPTHVFLIGSDVCERQFRLLKISRSPVTPPEDYFDPIDQSSPTIEIESPMDRLWRLEIFEDSHTYTPSEVTRLLHELRSANRVSGISVIVALILLLISPFTALLVGVEFVRC